MWRNWKRVVGAGVVVLTALVVAPPVSGNTVGGFVTNASVVSGNSFVAARYTDMGVYGLKVFPSSGVGNGFVPGGEAVVQWGVLPEEIKSVEHEYQAGDEVVHVVTLPDFLVPVVDGDEGWDVVQGEDGVWTARHTQRFDVASTYVYSAGDVLRLPARLDSRAQTTSVSVSVPDHFVSKHPHEEAQIVAQGEPVDYGVYNLKVTPDKGDEFGPSETGKVEFRTYLRAES